MDSDQEMLTPSTVSFRRGSVYSQVLAAVIAWLAPICMGFGIGYSSPAIPKLQKDIADGGLDLTVPQTSWFASLLAIGALVGGPFAGIVIEKLGRKYGIMLSGFPFVLGWFLIAYAPNVYVLYAGRFLTGFGCGMASLSAPTYIAEVASKNMRGLLGGGFQLAVVIGILAVFCFGIPLSYRWLAILAAVVSTIMVLAMLIIPETPRWFFDRHETASGMKSLRWLRGDGADIEEEAQEIETSILNQGQSVSFTDMFRYPNLYKPLIISVLLMFFQQFSGINAVIFFSTTIFQDSFGSDNDKGQSDGAALEEIASVILAVVQVVFTFIGCILMDRAGRRILLITAGSIMAFSSVTFAVYYVLTERNVADQNQWYMKATSIGSLGIYISGFSIGWGPIPWLVMSEIFPAKARGVSSGIATATNWTFAFIVTFFFQSLQNTITPYGTFFAFAVINILGVIFVALFLPETKGKSLEDIERYFSSNADYERLNGEEQD